jgi:hypothetical protein
MPPLQANRYLQVSIGAPDCQWQGSPKWEEDNVDPAWNPIKQMAVMVPDNCEAAFINMFGTNDDDDDDGEWKDGQKGGLVSTTNNFRILDRL